MAPAVLETHDPVKAAFCKAARGVNDKALPFGVARASEAKGVTVATLSPPAGATTCAFPPPVLAFLQSRETDAAPLAYDPLSDEGFEKDLVNMPRTGANQRLMDGNNCILAMVDPHRGSRHVEIGGNDTATASNAVHFNHIQSETWLDQSSVAVIGVSEVRNSAGLMMLTGAVMRTTADRTQHEVPAMVVIAGDKTMGEQGNPTDGRTTVAAGHARGADGTFHRPDRSVSPSRRSQSVPRVGSNTEGKRYKDKDKKRASSREVVAGRGWDNIGTTTGTASADNAVPAPLIDLASLRERNMEAVHAATLKKFVSEPEAAGIGFSGVGSRPWAGTDRGWREYSKEEFAKAAHVGHTLCEILKKNLKEQRATTEAAANLPDVAGGVTGK